MPMARPGSGLRAHPSPWSFPALVFALLVLHLRSQTDALPAQRPNIVLIIADDLGFNDVSFRGSNQIPTPNIDALAFSGVILDRHYVMPTCTPSRTALLTGQYPIRTGLQRFPLRPGEPCGLPLEFQTLPQQLKRLGYRTHLVGKWHLGFHSSQYLPTRRGFDHHLGYWNGFIGYFDHTVLGGFDMHEGEAPAWGLQGRYATHLFTEYAERAIAQHNSSGGPLFLQIAHLAVHTGRNGTEVEVPDEAENDRRFSYIQGGHRRRLAGALRELDHSVGRVVEALQEKGILNNTIILFMSDNGGEAVGIYRNDGSNWPLRGQKATLYEGGVRGAAAVWSPQLAHPHSVHRDLFHETDWLPTFYEAAGGAVSDLGRIDGKSQWSALTEPTSKAARSEVLVQINEAGAIIQDNWKLIKGNQRPLQSKYLGESGRGAEVPAYDADAVVSSGTARALATAWPTSRLTAGIVLGVRDQATLPASCRPLGDAEPDPACQPYCLFDILEDPCESKDVSAAHREVGEKLLRRLQHWEALAVPKMYPALDPAAEPARHNMTWAPWLDASGVTSSPSKTRSGVTQWLALLLASLLLYKLMKTAM